MYTICRVRTSPQYVSHPAGRAPAIALLTSNAEPTAASYQRSVLSGFVAPNHERNDEQSEGSPPTCCSPPVDVPPIPDPNYGYDQLVIHNFVQDPVVPLPKSVLVLSTQFFAARRARVVGKRPDLLDDALSIPHRNVLELLRR